MFCPNCGKEIDPKASVCLGCGVSVSRMIKHPEGKVSAGWWWLGFLLPIAGLFVWLFCNDTEPLKAKKAGWGALVSVIVSVAIVILYFVAVFALLFLIGSSY